MAEKDVVIVKSRENERSEAQKELRQEVARVLDEHRRVRVEGGAVTRGQTVGSRVTVHLSNGMTGTRRARPKSKRRRGKAGRRK